MYIPSQKTKLATIITALTMVGAHPSIAQNDQEDESQFEEAVLIVSPRVVARDRVPSIQPILSYDVEFFQRFEPINLQDMLKRVPGLNLDSLFPSTGRFSDTEANSFGYRGSFGGTTGQILINGRRIPGINSVNAISLSAIPAELVKQINIIRVNNAGADAQGVGLTIDIILKDGTDVPTGEHAYWRISANKTGDQQGHNISGAFRGEFGNGYDVSFNYTMSDTPLESNRAQFSAEYADDIDGNVNPEDFTIDRTLDNSLVEQKQMGFNLTFDKLFDNGAVLSTHSYLFDFERNDMGGREYTSNYYEDVFTQVLANDEELQHMGIGTTLSVPLADESDHLFTVNVSYDKSTFDYALASSFIDETEVSVDLAENLENTELKFESRLDFNMNSGNSFALGVHVEENELRIEEDVDVTALDQSRFDIFGIYTWNAGEAVSFDVGYRYETTEYESFITGAGEQARISEEESGGYPSAHLWWKLADDHDIRIAAARNVNRLGMMQFFQADTNSYSLNHLIHEDYFSFEAGYDYQFSNKRGILGFTLFHKTTDSGSATDSVTGEAEVQDYLTEQRPELLPIVQASIDQGDSIDFLDFVQSGNQEITYKGIEVDFSIPMDLVGLPDLSISSNISYFERETPELKPADSIAANFTLDHKIGSTFSYGVSYNVKTDETTEFTDETIGLKVVYERDPSIDVFVENRFSDNFVVRLAGRNVTDAWEQVSQTNYRGDDINPTFTYSDRTESEPNIQLILRGAF